MDPHLEVKLATIEKKLDAVLLALKGGAHAPSAAGGGGAPTVAPDADLDGQHGNPNVMYPSNRWAGESFDGRPFSECSPEFLLVHAEWLEYKAANPKPGKEKSAQYQARDAARARGWALRNTRNPPRPRVAAPATDYAAPAAGPSYGADDEIPF